MDKRLVIQPAVVPVDLGTIPDAKKIRLQNGIPVFLIDERFTSQIALRSMIDGGVKKKGRRNKMIVDMVSASIILQSYLDSRSVNTKTKI